MYKHVHLDIYEFFLIVIPHFFRLLSNDCEWRTMLDEPIVIFYAKLYSDQFLINLFCNNNYVFLFLFVYIYTQWRIYNFFRGGFNFRYHINNFLAKKHNVNIQTVKFMKHSFKSIFKRFHKGIRPRSYLKKGKESIRHV